MRKETHTHNVFIRRDREGGKERETESERALFLRMSFTQCANILLPSPELLFNIRICHKSNAHAYSNWAAAVGTIQGALKIEHKWNLIFKNNMRVGTGKNYLLVEQSLHSILIIAMVYRYIFFAFRCLLLFPVFLFLLERS